MRLQSIQALRPRVEQLAERYPFPPLQCQGISSTFKAASSDRRK
jgi:hypothetical protein